MVSDIPKTIPNFIIRTLSLGFYLDKFGGSPSAEFIFVFSYVFKLSEKGTYKEKKSRSFVNITTSKTLIDQLKEPGNDSAWEKFYKLYSPLIFGFVRKRHFDCATAEDILQMTMCELVRYIPRFEYDPSKGRFSSFLCRIVSRMISKWLIINKPNRIFWENSISTGDVDISDPQSFQMFGEFEREEKRVLLRHGLVRVKERVQPLTWESFYLYVLRGRSAKETAMELGISEAAVFKHKERIIACLKEEVKRLQNEIGELDEAADWGGEDYKDQNLKTSYVDTEIPSAEIGNRIDLVRKMYMNHPPPKTCGPKFFVITSGNSRWVDITGKFSIGSDASNILQLNSDTVSKKHCFVFDDQGNWIIRDLQSKNGVWVNNKPISEKILHNGDIITLGDIQLVFIS